jgi:DNA-3-methyladenine glycosylase II
MPKTSHKAAAEQLAAREPVLAKLLEAAGPPVLRQPQSTHFAALVRSVLYQQLAGAAAAAIHARLVEALDGDVSPASLLSLPQETLRAAGLSANKTASLRDLATKVLDGTVVLDPRRLARESDEEVITRLSTVRGVGRWTAQMFLMFQLERPDVLPTGDLGIRRAIERAYELPGLPLAPEMEAIAEPWRPFRTLACRYLWRSLLNEPT